MTPRPDRTTPVDASPAAQQFVLAHGWGARACELAAVTGLSIDEIERVKRTGATRCRAGSRSTFAELFCLWHGRAPTDEDWPAPRKLGRRGSYEWQAPDVALLASLVGQLGKQEIASILTERLRRVSGDPTAERSEEAVQVRLNQIGLQTSDLVGGLSVKDAGREIRSVQTVYHAIRQGQLPTRKVGRLILIPREAWDAWKARRVLAPKDYVPLAPLKAKLAIRSDKLSEFARMGLVPTAIRCHPYGTKARTTKFGTWYIDPKAARKLVADRRAGRPMPWHGKAMPDNLRAVFRRWSQRRHPQSCETCRTIWGGAAPRSEAEFSARYPPLAFGAKRHLTRVWAPGWTLDQLARRSGRTRRAVERAIGLGLLPATRHGRATYITRTDATRWIARRCPTGDCGRSWISLATARKQYGFDASELRRLIGSGELASRIGTNGPMRGITYVGRHQCAMLRESLGYTLREAARRVRLTPARLEVLLRGVDWRGTGRIPAVTLDAAMKRMASQRGRTIEEAARDLAQTVEWVRDRILDGTIRVSRARWDRRRVYISDPMVERLRSTFDEPMRSKPGAAWIRLGEAAMHAGVSTTTVIRWASDGDVALRHERDGAYYHRRSIEAAARAHWQRTRLRRAPPPPWLSADRRSSAAAQARTP